MIILTVYGLIGFSATSVLDPAQQWFLGYFVAALITIVFLVNLVVMVVLTPARLIKYCKKRKARKAREK